MNPTSPAGYTLEILGQAIGATVHGPGQVRITGVNSLEGARPGDLAVLKNDRLLDKAIQSQASAFLLSNVQPRLTAAQLISPNPQYDLVRLINQFFTPARPSKGIAKEVLLGEEVRIGPDAIIGPFVTLGDRARIGARVTLCSGVYIGEDVHIGDDSILYPNVIVLDRCRIGSGVILHAGTVIGSDGFGYLQHEGRNHKIPQRGIVVIGDDVEIGANVTIDRATFGETRIQQGTKVDNQVQIAHNVTIDEHCIVIAQVGIAGSTQIGKHVVIGGQAGLLDHLTVGDRAMIAAGSGIEKNVEAGAIMSGRPAKRHEVTLRTQVLIQRLPELRQQLNDLEKRLATLEANQPPRPSPRTKNSP